MKPRFIGFVLAGAVLAAPFNTAQAASPTIVIQKIECRDSLTLPPEYTNQSSICWGYDKTRQTIDPSLPNYQPMPFKVEKHLTVTAVLDTPINVVSATVYVAPPGGTLPEWTPAMVQRYNNESDVMSVAIHNAFSNAFPLITKKCSLRTNEGTRGFRIYIEVKDGNGVAYRSNSLYLYIDPEGIVNPPVSDTGQRCELYLP